MSSERLHPAASGSRCQVPNIRQSPGSPAEVGERRMGGTGGVRDTTRTRPRESPDQDSWVLTGIREPKGSDLGTLYMGYG